MSSAVPPNEIIWENTQYGQNFVKKRKFLFWGLSIICMAVCYAVIGSLLHIQKTRLESGSLIV